MSPVPESKPNVTLAHQLSYKAIQEANCKYRFLRIPLNNVTSSSVTVGAATSQLLEWKLPNTVYNLAQSFIGYKESIASSGTTPKFNYVFEDTIGLASNIYFGNASGADLCNLNYVNKYIKIARKITTPMQNFLTNDAETSGLYPSNDLVAANYYPSVTQNAGGTATGVTNYIEPQYLTVGADATALERNRLFPLGSIPDTIFSVDKDIYIPTDMFLRVTAGPGNANAYFSTAATTPATGTSALAVDTTLSNIYLYLAVETNQRVIDSVMTTVRETGLTLNIPYTTAFRNSSTGTVANVNLPLSSQYGKKLKQILTTVWNGTETSNTAGDCGNHGGVDAAQNGTKIKTYNTFLNNRQLQDTSIDCTYAGGPSIANFNDWRENSRHCLGSVIQNRAVYAQNWFHLDKFYEDNKGSSVPVENRQDGYDMNQGPVLHQLQATTVNGTWIYYQFASFSRDVQLNSSGFIYV